MSDLTPAALVWLSGHHGVITTSRLQATGVGRKTTLRLLDTGALRLVERGIYVATSVPSSLEQRCCVLCAAHPRGFITGPTAGALGGLRRMPSKAPLHIAVRHGVHLPPSPGVRFRQTTALTEADRRSRPDGIVVASWVRLAFDLAADLRPLDHLSVLQQLRHEQKVSVDALVAIERRLGHPARPGSGLFRRNLSRLSGTAPNESHPEVVLADVLSRRGLPIEHQTRLVELPNGRTARIDFAVPEVGWGIEVDVHPEHLTLDGNTGDVRRDRQFHLIGWQVEHVTEIDLENIEALADELVSLYHARRRSYPSVDCPPGAHSTLG